MERKGKERVIRFFLNNLKIKIIVVIKEIKEDFITTPAPFVCSSIYTPIYTCTGVPFLHTNGILY